MMRRATYERSSPARTCGRRSIFPVVLAVFAATALVTPAQDAGYETPPVLKAADLVDPSLLSGPQHRVDAEVRNDGFMNHFQIRSDFGDFEAESEELLEIRVREVAALAKLAEISKTEAFADALKSSVAKPVTAVKNVATDPVGTIKGVPEGLNKRFKGLYYKAKKTGRKVKEEVQEELEDDESGPVGLPLLQPPRAPTPARAAPPDRRIRNSRLSEKRSFRGPDPSLSFSLMTPAPCD